MHRYFLSVRHCFAIFKRVPKPIRWLLFSGVIFLLALNAPRAIAQVPDNIGFLFQGLRTLNSVGITTVEYTGECPGRETPEIRGWFTSATTPPGGNRRVIIRNVTPGMDPNDQPYTDREYNEGTASEDVLIEFGSEHSRRRFRVLEGENDFQYEIRERRNVLESGTFTASFINSVQPQVRNSTRQAQQVCANSAVGIGACADVRTRTQWTCPGGRVIGQQVEPQGPIRTIFSNQTFLPVSYSVLGRVYYLNPGQQQELTGNNLGSIQFRDPRTGAMYSEVITPGTLYRFTNSGNVLDLAEWYR